MANGEKAVGEGGKEERRRRGAGRARWVFGGVIFLLVRPLCRELSPGETIFSPSRQGDRIGRFFAYRAIVYSVQFCKNYRRM
jgi:hypothetical protein